MFGKVDDDAFQRAPGFAHESNVNANTALQATLQLGVAQKLNQTINDRKKLIKKCFKKCEETELFQAVCSGQDDDVKKVLKCMQTEDLQRLSKLDLDLGYDPGDVADKMDFVNKLVPSDKHQLIESNISRLQQAIDLCHQTQVPVPRDTSRMLELIVRWKESVKVVKKMEKFFRQVTRQKKNDFVNELRQLSMDNIDDTWLIKHLENIQLPQDELAKDYLMIARLVKPAKQRELVIDRQIMTSEKIAEMYRKLEGNVGNLAIELYFEDTQAEADERAEYFERIDEIIMRLFTQEEKKGRKKHDPIGAFRKLQKYPELHKKAAIRLTNPEFITKTYGTWSEIMKTPSDQERMVHIMKTFGQEAEHQFYMAIMKMMLTKDQLADHEAFHPEVLAVQEQLAIKQVPIKGLDFPTSQIDDMKPNRLWDSDYPLLCYRRTEDQLVFVNLAERDLPSTVVRPPFPRGEFSFISFVDENDSEHEASISVLYEAKDQLVITTYSYTDPFKQRFDFSDSNDNDWVHTSVRFPMSPKLRELVWAQRKTSLVRFKGKNRKDNIALIMQTDQTIYVYELSQSADSSYEPEKLTEDGYSVKLEFLHGYNDRFYFAIRDDGSQGDTFHQLTTYLDKSEGPARIKTQVRQIFGPYTGEIIAFELDPLNANDVSSLNFMDQKQKEKGKANMIYLIDQRLKLFKLVLEEKETHLIWQTNLAQKSDDLVEALEMHVKGKNFVRLSISQRCITIFGTVFSMKTGNSWSFIPDSFVPYEPYTEVLQVQNMPISHLQIALATQKSDRDNLISDRKPVFLIKNAPSSRRLTTVDRRRRDVVLLTVISEDLILIKFKKKKGSYWSLMDASGYILPIDERLQNEVLSKNDWTKVEVRNELDSTEASQSYFINSTFSTQEDGITEQDKSRVMIVFSRSQESLDTIAVVLDVKTQTIIQINVFDHQKIADKIQPQLTVSEKVATQIDDLCFVNFIGEFGTLYMVTSDPKKTKMDVIQETFDFESSGLNKSSGDVQVKLVVLVVFGIHKDKFDKYSQALMIKNTIYIKGHQNEILRINRDQDTDFYRIYYNADYKIEAPSGKCILQPVSPFYKCSMTGVSIGDKTDEKELKFQDQIQLSYADSTLLYNVPQIDYISDEVKGFHEVYNGVKLVMDPEKFVDPGISLSSLEQETLLDGDLHVNIWTHIKARDCKNLYTVEQDWQWAQKSDDENDWYGNDSNNNNRTYSFLGLYRKYSEADLMELIRLEQLLDEKKTVRQVDMLTLFCSFFGISVFAIFFGKVQILQQILEQLEIADLDIQMDEEENQCENHNLRRSYFFLTQHEIHKNSSKQERSQVAIDEKEKEKKGPKRMMTTLFRQGFRGVKRRLMGLEEADCQARLREGQVNCNSLLYRILYSNNVKSRDLVLQIASYCENFSLDKVIFTQQDVESILQRPSDQVVKAFDSILCQSPETKAIHTLNIAGDAKMITYLDDCYKVTAQRCEQMVHRRMIKQGVSFDEQGARMTKSVIVKMLNLKWLMRKKKNFLDLVEILIQPRSESIQPTEFVSSLLDGFWSVYYKKIRNTFFIPYLCYMVCVINLMMLSLDPEWVAKPLQPIIYYPMLGATLVFYMNQVMVEVRQWQDSITTWNYYADGFNILDNAYLLMNGYVLIMTTTGQHGYFDLNLSRTMAAISTGLLWIKLIDWLRLFEETAFYVHLSKETLLDISHFLVVMVIWYMTFGTTFYILSLNRVHEPIMPDLYNFWALNAFENQYELGLGEFQKDSFKGETEDTNYKLIFMIFFLATFFIQIVFLNMLIAIMGDTFGRVTEGRQNHSRCTKLNLMGNYTNLISLEKDNEGSDDEDDPALMTKSMKRKSVSAGNALMRQSTSIINERYCRRRCKNFWQWLCCNNKKVDQSTEKSLSSKHEDREEILYVVMVEADGGADSGCWEGQLHTLKNYMDKSISACQHELEKKMDKINECIKDAEARDNTHERDLKSRMSKLNMVVKDEIKTVKHAMSDMSADITEQKNVINTIANTMQRLESKLDGGPTTRASQGQTKTRLGNKSISRDSSLDLDVKIAEKSPDRAYPAAEQLYFNLGQTDSKLAPKEEVKGSRAIEIRIDKASTRKSELVMNKKTNLTGQKTRKPRLNDLMVVDGSTQSYESVQLYSNQQAEPQFNKTGSRNLLDLGAKKLSVGSNSTTTAKKVRKSSSIKKSSNKSTKRP